MQENIFNFDNKNNKETFELTSFIKTCFVMIWFFTTKLITFELILYSKKKKNGHVLCKKRS